MYSSDDSRCETCSGAATLGVYSSSSGDDWKAQAGQTILQAGADWLDSQSRRGGADPCCPPGFDPAGKWPRNAGQEGAPPDYRTPGSPLEDPSPSGAGRLKDDFCDCIPIAHRGSYWMLGEIRDGIVYPGPVQNLDDAVWVKVTNQGVPVSVPGAGNVRPPPGSGGADAGAFTEARIGPVLGVGLLLAGAYTVLRRRGG